MARDMGTRACTAVAVAALAIGGCGDDDPAGPQTRTPTPTATVSATPGPPESCGEVAYTPQSDNGAFDITAIGTDCPTARAVATAAENQRSSFSAEGFGCSGQDDTEAALSSTKWTCTSGDARVTFTTS